jgi:DNA polymerase III subunit epsilon
MTYLVFDTETSGLWNFQKTFEYKDQPKPVQLCAIVYNDSNQEIASMNTLIQPDDWTISPEASSVHGITEEEALKNGVTLEAAVTLFSEFCDIVDIIVAHNIFFDENVMKHAAHILGRVNMFESKNMFCTMRASTNILQIRKPSGGFKWPKLSEAYKYFTGEELKNAHDAKVDVTACQRIYLSLLEKGVA